MAYTIKNLRETTDVAPRFGFSEAGEVHFPRDELDAESIGLGLQVLNPNSRLPFGHRHDKAEEIYVVLAGSGRIRLDEEEREISELDAIRVEPQVARGLQAGPDGMTVLVFGPRHEADGETLQDFWPD